MAVQMAINYISAMGDKTIQTHAQDIGLVEPEAFTTVRGSTEKEKAVFATRYDTKVENDSRETK